MKAQIIILFLLFSGSLANAQNNDTIYEGVKYNSIIRSSNGKISHLVNIKLSMSKYVWNGPAIYFYSNTKKSKQGELKDGLMTGLWTFYYLNGQKEKEGTYIIGQDMIFINKGHKPYDGEIKEKPMLTSIETGVWNYWDEDGKEIPLTVYNSIRTKTSLQMSIDYFLQLGKNKTLTDEQNTTFNYYKNYFKKKYPLEIFWKDSLSTEYSKVLVDKSNLKKTEIEYTVKNSFAINDSISITFYGCSYQMSQRNSSDSIILSAGTEPWNEVEFSIQSTGYKNIVIMQYYVTTISISPGYGNHFELNNYKHGFSKANQSFHYTDSTFKLANPNFGKHFRLPFPIVDLAELKLEAALATGNFMPDEIRMIKSPYEPPCQVVISGYFIRIAAKRITDNKDFFKFIYIGIPIGC